MNIAVLSGHAVRDAELREGSAGGVTWTVRLACNDRVLAAEGFETRTFFINVVVCGERARALAGRIKRGCGLVVWGRLEQDSWVDGSTSRRRTSTKIFATGVEFLGRAPAREEGAPAHNDGIEERIARAMGGDGS